MYPGVVGFYQKYEINCVWHERSGYNGLLPCRSIKRCGQPVFSSL